MTGGEPIRITDDLGDELVLERPPERIVSLVPSITETLIELGAAETVVGITTYCVHPENAVPHIPKVGGTKGFSTETIDELRPDLVIANKEENKKEQIATLREKYRVFVTYPRTVDEAMKTVRDLGILTGRSPRASEITEALEDVIVSTPPTVRRKPLGTVCMIWRDPWMVAGVDSYVSDLLETFGFRNVFRPAEGRYPKTTLAAVLDRTPDVIFLPSEPYAFTEADRTDVESALDERGHRAVVLPVEGSYLTWFGYRTGRGLRFLRDLKINLLSNKD